MVGLVWIVLHKNKVTREIFEDKNILSKALTGVGFEIGNSLQRT